jgi:hypothetical protein
MESVLAIITEELGPRNSAEETTFDYGSAGGTIVAPMRSR